jgi:glycosyltransferase involved in cell wall biosynthesis
MQNNLFPVSAPVNHLAQVDIPTVSSVICTRNRGNQVQAAIESVLANQHSNFELIVVDQSTNDVTEKAIQPFINDPRFTYIHSNTTGQGISRNIGLKCARADIVAFTDDDCTVSTHWLNAVEDIFWKHPQVTVVFCSVEPGPYDRSLGSIPYRHYSKDKIYRSVLQYSNTAGMGAGMSVRKSAILKWGGFDETLGPGAYFRSADDIDVAWRALLKRDWVYELSSVSVIHHGFRNWVEYKELTKRDFYSIGAVHAKLAKRSFIKALPTILYHTLYISLWMPVAGVVSFKEPKSFIWFIDYWLDYLKRPRSLTRFVFYWQGFFEGMKTPLDHSNIVYLYQSDD